MGRLKNVNEMVKATLNEGSMASAGANPIAVVKEKMKKMKMKEEEEKEIMDMMKEMELEEEDDMEGFKKAVESCGNFAEMKKTVEKYMK